jgi:hypothetical protein
MSSKKDKDYHFLRNSEKYLGEWHYDHHIRVFGEKTPEIAEREKEYYRVWGKYGFKSMVSNKRRRNITRKSNQKNKQREHQIKRAQFKAETRRLIDDKEGD